MRTSVYVGTSLDGFIARTDGNVDWLVAFEGPVQEDYAEFIGRIDAIVIGTFETALGFPSWPYGVPIKRLRREDSCLLDEQ